MYIYCIYDSYEFRIKITNYFKNLIHNGTFSRYDL